MTYGGTNNIDTESALTFDGSTLALTGDLTITGGSLTLPVAEKLYFGGGNHTYISEDIDDRLRFFVGGDEFMRFTQQDAAGEIISFYSDVYMDDNLKIHLGNSQDLRLFHDASNSYVYGYGTGNLYMGHTVADADTVLVGDNGSGSPTAYITLDGSAGTVNIDKEIHLSTHLNMGDGDLESNLELLMISKIVHTSNINFIHSTVSDRDIYFGRVNDGGSSVDAIKIDASDAGTAIFNQDIRLNTNDTYIHLKDASGNQPRMFGINSSSNTYIYDQ